MSGLSKRLKSSGIPGCSVSNLRNFRQFYQTYSEIHQTLPGELLNPVSLEPFRQKFCLSWSHYQVLINLPTSEERDFYEIEVAANQWSIREKESIDRLKIHQPEKIHKLWTLGMRLIVGSLLLD
jgi:hypothetical protein